MDDTEHGAISGTAAGGSAAGRPAAGGTAGGSTETGAGAGAVGGGGERIAVATLLVLGASGDLAARLLLPGLAHLLASDRDRDVTSSLRLVGSGTEDWDDAMWRQAVQKAFSGASGPVVDAVRDGSRYLQADITDAGDLRRVLDACTAPVAVYFALPPAVTAKACTALLDVQLPAGTQLVMEKPFGLDEDSARSLNGVVGRLVPEKQVHRVDHFLGTATVLNTIGLRFGNRLFEPVWDAAQVERVDIVYDEDLALEGRARYYDTAGALVDMIQSHLLQVMALLAMDPPASLGERDVRDRKAELLRATRLAGPPASASRRARYTAGRIGDRDLPDYAAESGVDPGRGTETLAEVVLAVDTWRWAGVPFRLRSGKALGTARKEAVVTFRAVPHLPTGLSGTPVPTRLHLRFSPDVLELELTVNSPGDPYALDATTLSSTMAEPDLPAYGEVLAGVLTGDPLLSVRGDTAEECWRIVAPVVSAWRSGEVPLQEYPAGSGGPPSTHDFPDV